MLGDSDVEILLDSVFFFLQQSFYITFLVMGGKLGLSHSALFCSLGRFALVRDTHTKA